MVPTESLLVMSRANDGRLISLLEQVDRILLSLHGPVLVEGIYSQGTVIEVIRPGAYRLKDDEGNVLTNTWNIEQLRHFFP